LATLASLQQCVSPTLYNQSTGSQDGDPVLTPALRAQYENINQVLIQKEVMMRQKGFICLGTLCQILSLIIMAYGIAVLVKGAGGVFECVAVGVYLLLESWNVLTVLIAVLFIIFAPLLCLFACCYLCCGGRTGLIDRDALNIPSANRASARVIEEAGGSCTICLQNFSLQDNLITLPCSPQHVFH
jgi:hypothetical protein